MGFKPRTSAALYRTSSGETWKIAADGLTLVTERTRTTFDDYPSLLAEADKRLSTLGRSYELAGNFQARDAGTLNQVSPDVIETVRAQYGPRRSIWTDAWSELAEVLQDPTCYEGGVLVIDGDVTINGSWDAGNYAAVVILGNCTVEGLLYQFQTEPWFIVTGHLLVDRLVMAGNLDVGGDIRAKASLEFESGLGYAHAGRNIAAPTIFVWDMSVTCHVLTTDLYVSRCEVKDRLACDHAAIAHHLKQLSGQGLAEHLHPCLLDYQAQDGTLNTPGRPGLSDVSSKLIHILGLPVAA